ncbi:TIGR02391 family protein, partial [Nocardiopsis protaetiae]|uniref:TIGR02391 family protein n=1 Tax=Nocardiopsis protaetiae TaxID=3382270 RepID=UPI00387B7E13
MSGVPDVDPNASNKRKRLWAALMTQQQRNQAANCIIRFITEAMAPGRYVQDRARFEALKDAINEPLALLGLRVNEAGKLARGARAANLDEVARLAGRLQSELRRRGVHPQVIRYCEEEILRQSVFHAVFEATKGLAERLREMSGSTLDGADLVDH